MRGTYSAASRQREHVTGRRFAPNSPEEAQMMSVSRATACQILRAEMERLAGDLL